MSRPTLYTAALYALVSPLLIAAGSYRCHEPRRLLQSTQNATLATAVLCVCHCEASTETARSLFADTVRVLFALLLHYRA